MLCHKPVGASFHFANAAALYTEPRPTYSRGAAFRRMGPTYIIVHVKRSGEHFGRRARRASPVLLPVRGDDVVAGVFEPVAHEAPGEDVWLRMSLQVDAQV